MSKPCLKKQQSFRTECEHVFAGSTVYIKTKNLNKRVGTRAALGI